MLQPYIEKANLNGRPVTMTMDDFVREINLEGGVEVVYTEGGQDWLLKKVSLGYTGNMLSLHGIDSKLGTSFYAASEHEPEMAITPFRGEPVTTPTQAPSFAHVRVSYLGANWFFRL